LGLKKNNLPTIETSGLRIKDIYDNNDSELNIKEEEGISLRVDKI
jgi:coenzyme F420 hydrogenase subunit beta